MWSIQQISCRRVEEGDGEYWGESPWSWRLLLVQPLQVPADHQLWRFGGSGQRLAPGEAESIHGTPCDILSVQDRVPAKVLAAMTMQGLVSFVHVMRQAETSAIWKCSLRIRCVAFACSFGWHTRRMHWYMEMYLSGVHTALKHLDGKLKHAEATEMATRR